MKLIRAFSLLAVLGLPAATTALAQGQKLSPRESAEATIGGAKILIDYGRPSKRGREIFGGLVPWGQVWRTGANEATTLKTDKSLMFGSLMVPAGTYTLYTIPNKDAWQLVINKQTGQWGTSYDQSKDLGRVNLKVETLSAVVEQFTIKLVPAGSNGTLRLEWDKTAASIDFMVH